MSGEALTRCSCGKSAVVGLNNTWFCQQCFEVELVTHRAMVDRLVRLAKQGGTR